MVLKSKLSRLRGTRTVNSRRLSTAAVYARPESSTDSHDAFPRRLSPRTLPSPPPLTLERELFYGRLILHTILSSPIIRQATLSTSPSDSPKPDFIPEWEPEHKSDTVSDQEWEIRTGRAIDLLQQTLPDFFETGLVSSADASSATSSSHQENKATWSLPSATGTWNVLKDKLTMTSKSDEESNEAQSIYSPRIRLTYTPPTPLPTPFPRTLHAEGLHLYIASSIFVRHTLNALYTDLKVELKRVRANQGGPSQGNGSISPVPVSPASVTSAKRSREKNITFGLGVTGVGRVSGAPTEWEVNCTYMFSPVSGLIIHHSVDSIEPAPHQALFEALGKFGLLDGYPGGASRPGGVDS